MTDAPANNAPENPGPSAPLSFKVRLCGFDDEPQARVFGDLIGATIIDISRLLDVERLHGITVAYDYDKALAQLDRGYQAIRPLSRTADSRLLGVAMAVPVLRNGSVKAHLVLDARFVLPLQDETSEYFEQALYLVAHECGHIEDLKHRDESFPGTILQQQITKYEEAVLDPVASAFWEEYAACRASTALGSGQAAIYEQNFVSVLAAARDDANAAIRSYRWHADISRVLEEAGRPLCEPLRMAAYLLGHLDGLNQGWDAVPQARDAIAGSLYQIFIERLLAVVRDFWSRRGRWQSRSEFIPLHDLARDVFERGGLILRPLSDGSLYVDIPFTPETMP
jgi:hypothetical protein